MRKIPLQINGHRAIISFAPDVNSLRGEFIGLNGGADFCANDIAGLLTEGAKSMRCSSKFVAKRTSSPTARPWSLVGQKSRSRAWGA